MKLKPCPFCGNKEPDVTIYYSDGNVVGSAVVCNECGASVCHVEACSAEENIAAWNRRTDRDGAR